MSRRLILGMSVPALVLCVAPGIALGPVGLCGGPLALCGRGTTARPDSSRASALTSILRCGCDAARRFIKVRHYDCFSVAKVRL